MLGLRLAAATAMPASPSSASCSLGAERVQFSRRAGRRPACFLLPPRAGNRRLPEVNFLLGRHGESDATFRKAAGPCPFLSARSQYSGAQLPCHASPYMSGLSHAGHPVQPPLMRVSNPQGGRPQPQDRPLMDRIVRVLHTGYRLKAPSPEFGKPPRRMCVFRYGLAPACATTC